MQSQVHRKGKTFSVYFYEKTGKHSSDCNCVNRMIRLFTGESFRIHGSGTPGKLVNGVGAGDSMVAGFMAGWMEKREYGHAFRLGVAAGSASAFSENLATGEEIRRLYVCVESRAVSG